MSILQNTISMLEVLSESDLIKVQNSTKKLSKRHESKSINDSIDKFLKPKSRENIYRDLEISRKQSNDGEYQEADVFLDEIRKEYGI